MATAAMLLRIVKKQKKRYGRNDDRSSSSTNWDITATAMAAAIAARANGTIRSTTVSRWDATAGA